MQLQYFIIAVSINLIVVSSEKRTLSKKKFLREHGSDFVNNGTPTLQPAQTPKAAGIAFTLPPFLSFTLSPILNPSSVSSIGPILAPFIDAHKPTINPVIPPLLAPFVSSFTFPPDISSLTLPPALSPGLITSFGPAIVPTIESFGPAIEPSISGLIPTFNPAISQYTLPPAFSPSILSSFAPAIIALLPTSHPVAAVVPSIQPTILSTSITPTYSPTIMTVNPTTGGTSYAPSVTHTIGPTAADSSVAYDVTQAFFGITSSIYDQATTINNGVLAQTVATYVTQISATDVTINNVATADVNQRKRSLRVNTALSTPTSSILITYRINIPSITTAGFATASAAYTTTSSELSAAITSGAFNATLHQDALATPDCTLTSALSGNATFGNYTQSTVTTSSSGSSGNNSAGSGFIAGIVTAVIVGITFLGFTILYLLRRRTKFAREGRSSNESTGSNIKQSEQSETSTASANPIVSNNNTAKATMVDNPLSTKPSAPPVQSLSSGKTTAKDNFATVGDGEDGPAFFMRDSVLDGFEDPGL